MRFIIIALVAGTAAAQGPMTTTMGGNTCKSDCSTSISNFDALKCDSCSTGFLKKEYCVYPGNSSFEAQGFESKRSYFWEKIIQNPQGLSEYPSVLKTITESAQTTFYNNGDEMPSGRVKTIHSIGVICAFKMDNAAESPYTGLFEPGHQEGFVRMGSAVDYSNGGLTPGLGIKFPRTGQLSGNYVALHSLDFAQSWNFFASNVSNHIPPPSYDLQQKVLVKKFNQASNCAPQVGLSDMARYSQDGKKHDIPKFPFKLFLVPSEEVQTPTTTKTVDQVNAEMTSFPLGTTLYTVYACGKAVGDEMTPTVGSVETACGTPLKLGAMITTNKCTSSSYGDKSFHIRHQPVEEDWQVDPSILKQNGYNAGKACGWGGWGIGEDNIATPPARCDKSTLNAMLSDDAIVV